MNGLSQVLADTFAAQLRTVTKRVGFIADAEVAAVMPEARAIHAANLARNPHPIDASISADLHEWAALGIALNIVARSRGYDVSRERLDGSRPPVDWSRGRNLDLQPRQEVP